MENEKQEEKKVSLNEVLGSILSNNVNISNEEYEKLLNSVAENYDRNNNKEVGKDYTPPTLDERRERIKANYYGSSINFLYQILNTVNDFYRNYAPLIVAIAEKVGVNFEKVETEEDKAIRAAAEYLRASAEKKKAEKALLDKQNMNREQRRKANKETGEVIKFEPKK